MLFWPIIEAILLRINALRWSDPEQILARIPIIKIVPDKKIVASAAQY